MFVFKLISKSGIAICCALFLFAICTSSCGNDSDYAKTDKPLVNVQMLTLEQIVKLTDDEIITEIRMPLPNQQSDKASASEAISKAHDWLAKMDKSNYACYRAHHMYKKAISLATSEILTSSDLVEFKKAEDFLIRELTSNYHKVLKLLKEEKFTLADELLTRMQVYYPVKDSKLFQNTMKLKWFIQQQS